MANEDQLSILKQGVDVWNKWRANNIYVNVDLSRANLFRANLKEFDLRRANLGGAHLIEADLRHSNLEGTDLLAATLIEANLSGANLGNARLNDAVLEGSKLQYANLNSAILGGVSLEKANLSGASLVKANFTIHALPGKATVNETIFGDLDLGSVIGLEEILHLGPSLIGVDTIAKSKGKIPKSFLQGCGLSDADIEYAKLANPELTNEEINKILYTIFDLRANRAVQISPLFISYSHGDSPFVDHLEDFLNKKGVRFWRDIHDMKSGRMETQVDRAMRLNPTVLLILSEHSLQSDWVEHEVRTARSIEKEFKRDVLCPVALDDSWKNSPWAKRIMEQIMEYNILDFSEWKDDAKFGNTFNKLIDGLGLFYK